MIIKRKRSGFTLAEILVTLGVIGVIASIIVPTLVQDIQDAKLKTAYRKAYSVGADAWKMCVNNYQIVPRNSWDDDSANRTNFDAFKAKFNVVKDCNSNNNSACWTPGEMWANLYPTADKPSFIDSSGMVWTMITSESFIGVDVNGSKGPNKFGKDRFPFLPRVLNCANTSGDPCEIGLPERFAPYADILVYVLDRCTSPPCYYTSWLKQ